MSLGVSSGGGDDGPLARSGPRILIIRVLEACNAGCFMCAFAFSQDSYRFTAADAAMLAKEIEGTTYRLVRLTGGEPLLLSDLPTIIGAFSDIGLRTSIITSGWHLPAVVPQLVNANLSQVIVSLDGATAASHDRFRNCPGLFAAAVDGIQRFRQLSPRGSLRVNTVVGPHNVEELPGIYKLLVELDIDLWSIIPLKRVDSAWEYGDHGKLREAARRFREIVIGQKRPSLVGHSAHWTGRTDEEQRRFLVAHVPFTPSVGQCHLVDQVRYYTPKDGLVYPCNCVPHRVGATTLAEAVGEGALEPEGLATVRKWLRLNGPSVCTGCEPANAALGEALVDLDADPYGF